MNKYKNSIGTPSINPVELNIDMIGGLNKRAASIINAMYRSVIFLAMSITSANCKLFRDFNHPINEFPGGEGFGDIIISTNGQPFFPIQIAAFSGQH